MKNEGHNFTTTYFPICNHTEVIAVLECQKTKEKFTQAILVDTILLEKIAMFLKIVVAKMNGDSQPSSNVEFISENKNFSFDLDEMSNKIQSSSGSLEEFIRQSLYTIKK